MVQVNGSTDPGIHELVQVNESCEVPVFVGYDNLRDSVLLEQVQGFDGTGVPRKAVRMGLHHVGCGKAGPGFGISF
jgi:hypothetical protein